MKRRDFIALVGGAVAWPHAAAAQQSAVTELIFTERSNIAARALAARLPSIFSVRPMVVAGGLMSYGTEGLWRFRRAASFVDRILGGANPADLPVELPTKFELAINSKPAKVLRHEVSPSLLASANEVIE